MPFCAVMKIMRENILRKLKCDLGLKLMLGKTEKEIKTSSKATRLHEKGIKNVIKLNFE